MDKKTLLRLITEKLAAVLEVAVRAAQTAHETATHEENGAEKMYDTLGLEAAYLAAGQSRRVQFYHGGGGGEVPAKLRVLLSWDSDNTDLDLHLVTPDGDHVWYGNRSLANGATLDVDVTTGYGPEIIATPTPQKGPYLVYVNYFGGGYGSSEDGAEQAAQDLTTARITLVTEEGTPNEKQETFLVPMRKPGELTLVKRFSYP